MVVCVQMTPVRRRSAADMGDDDRERADVARRHAVMGRVIRLRREELGMSQQQLADRLEITQARVSMMESGGAYSSGKGAQSRPVGWNMHLVHKIEKMLRMERGTLFRAGDYVPALDIDSAIRTSPDLLESDKALILTVLSEARKKTRG